jgi:hypothetical protein
MPRRIAVLQLRLEGGYVDLNLTHEGGKHMVFALR